MIDTHVHLSDPRLGSQIKNVLLLAREAGVERVIVPATDLKDAYRIRKLLESFDGVYGLAGIYPGNVEGVGSLESAIAELAKILDSSKKMVGIGEIGLDCYWTKRNIEKQMAFFKAQLVLAAKRNLPVAVHSRGSGNEIKGVFDSMEKLPKGQFHCFGESEEFLTFVLERGFHVSFCGNITYPSAANLRNMIKKVPLDRLLLETDSPYLAPEPRHGSINVPSNVKILAEYIAGLLGIQTSTLINQTTENTLCLFFGG